MEPMKGMDPSPFNMRMPEPAIASLCPLLSFHLLCIGWSWISTRPRKERSLPDTTFPVLT